MVEVVAALIQKEDRLFICQRAKEKKQGLLWEFAGGKVEPHETKKQALLRECQEELGVTLQIGRQYDEVTYAYPQRTVHICFFWASLQGEEPKCLEHAAVQWVKQEELSDFTFCPADKAVVERLQRETWPKEE